MRVASRWLIRALAWGLGCVFVVTISGCATNSGTATGVTSPSSQSNRPRPSPVETPSTAHLPFAIGCQSSATGGLPNACQVVEQYEQSLLRGDVASATKAIAPGDQGQAKQLQYWIEHLINLQDVSIVRAVSSGRQAAVKVRFRAFVDDGTSNVPTGELTDWFYSLVRASPTEPWRISAEGFAP